MSESDVYPHETTDIAVRGMFLNEFFLSYSFDNTV